MNHSLQTLTMLRLILLLLIANSSFNVYANHPSKEWEIIIFSGGNKYKGVLKKVTDSSIVLSVKKNNIDEIVFRDIDKIRLRPIRNMSGESLLGFFIGGITGGVITGTALSAGKSGEPRALAGVVGGIAAGIVFGIICAILTPVVAKMISTKKITVQHTAAFYISLKQKLLRYSR